MALGWAVISTGLHVDHKIAPAINATPDAELVAVCSRDQDRAEACAAKHGGKVAYSDLGALLRDSRVDAVFIASPNARTLNMRCRRRRPANMCSAKNP